MHIICLHHDRLKGPEDHQFEQNSNWPILVQAIIFRSKPHRSFLLMTDGTLNESPDLFLLWVPFPSPLIQLWLHGNSHEHVHQHETKGYLIRKQIYLFFFLFNFVFNLVQEAENSLAEVKPGMSWVAVQRGHFIWVINLSQSDAHHMRRNGWTDESMLKLNIKDGDKDSDERL